MPMKISRSVYITKEILPDGVMDCESKAYELSCPKCGGSLVGWGNWIWCTNVHCIRAERIESVWNEDTQEDETPGGDE